MNAEDVSSDSGYSSNLEVSCGKTPEDSTDGLELIVWPNGTRQIFSQINTEDFIEKIIQYRLGVESDGEDSESSDSSSESSVEEATGDTKSETDGESKAQEPEERKWRRRIDCSGTKPTADKGRSFVFRAWPRNPNGSRLYKYEAPSGIRPEHFPQSWLWGATLFDFYKVQLQPGSSTKLMYATGSMLREWMEISQEKQWALPEINEAEAEPAPKLLKPYSLLEHLEGNDANSKSLTELQKTKPDDSASSPSKASESCDEIAPFLSEYIPISRLPRKLIVHDPDGVISRSENTSEECDEHIWTYKLSTSSSNCSSDIVKEAHLYLLEAERIGVGNHSTVYKAELRAPREMYFGFKDNEKIKYTSPAADSGRSEQSELGDEHQDDKNALQDLDEANTPKNTPSTNDRASSEPTLSSEEDTKVDGNCDLVESSFDATSSGIYKTDNLILGDDKLKTIDAPVESVTRTTSTKEKDKALVTTRIALKIGDSGDPHLRHEARVYECFPPHLFEHWSGYYIDPENLKYPVPVGPAVPQFYGYYTADKAQSRQASQKLRSIMLLEHCGKSLMTNKITNIDEKRECYSLLLRLHQAGFLHESIYDRNVVVQPGPLTAPPHKRTMGNPSFRLIDFGRTTQDPYNNSEFSSEKSQMAELLNLDP